MKLVSLEESPIDEQHTSARTTWRIVVHLNHQDLRALPPG
jgi:hypothetical protein